MFKRKLLIKIVVMALMLFSGVSFGAVNINKANAAAIAAELNGIGDAKAKAIVDYRKKHGAFKKADDLVNVKGIGKKLIEKNRSNILLKDKGGK